MPYFRPKRSMGFCRLKRDGLSVKKPVNQNKFIALLLSALLLTGCTFAAQAEDLISPPKLTNEQTEIYRALTNSKGTGLTLKYPKTGEYRSAFVFREEEPYNVTVFYELLSANIGTPTLWLTFLERRGGNWECTYDLALSASDIEKVEFSALGDREEENIIISYSYLNQSDKGVSVIAFTDGGVPEFVFTRNNCIYYEINDFIKSGEYCLFTVNQDRTLMESVACFHSWREGRFTILSGGGLSLNPDATEYIGAVQGYMSQDNPALFLEYIKGDGTYNTGIIYLRNGVIGSVVYVRDEQKREQNLALLEKKPNAYTIGAISRDIDGDGFIEAAGNEDFPGYYELAVNASDIARATVWYSVVDYSVLERLCYTYLSVNGDYVFFFPEEWIGNVTVKVSADGNEVVFWEYASEFESIYDVNTELLSVVCVPKGEKPEDDGFWLYDKETNGQFDYYVKIWNEFMTKEELREGLMIFENLYSITEMLGF